MSGRATTARSDVKHTSDSASDTDVGKITTIASRVFLPITFTIKHTKQLSVVTAMVGVLMLGSLYNPPQTSAAAILPSCTNSFVETWDWPADMRRGSRSGSTDGAGLPNFNPETDSYIFWKTVSNDTSSPKRNVFNGVVAANGTEFYLYDNAGVPTLSVGAGGATTKLGATIISEPRKLVPPGYYVWPSGYEGIYAHPAADTTAEIALSPAHFSCILVAHNVNYDSSWAWNKFVGAVEYSEGADVARSCSALDIGCWISKTFNTVGDSLVEVAKTGVRAIAALFTPDADQIAADFDAFNDFMTAKLGFLTYPLTFIVGLFNAFTNTSNNWCTPSSCSKDFGTLFGGHWVVNFNTPAIVYPTLWAWFKALLIGLTIVELLMAVKRKYKAVVSK